MPSCNQRLYAELRMCCSTTQKEPQFSKKSFRYAQHVATLALLSKCHASVQGPITRLSFRSCRMLMMLARQQSSSALTIASTKQVS